MLRTHSSSLAMSVSSSHGFTSSRIDDLAMSVGSVVVICAHRKNRHTDRESVTSSSEPNRSMSSSSSFESAAVLSATPEGPYWPRGFFIPGKLQ
uniref:Uncharacterized protein n=1 Tax=Oncorhynchus tshawytscha TaxID=74940 RepID=A0A8C8GHC4_ONCTS